MAPRFETAAETLTALLRSRAAGAPEHRIFTFLDHEGNEAATLAFAELDRRAREIGATLQGLALAGERVLMVFPPGPDCVVALYGCIYAGAMAVPCPPPDPGRKHAGPRLRTIVADATPRAVLSTRSIEPSIREVLAEGDAPSGGLAYVATDGDLADPGAWRDPARSGDEVALLQYTSGSTSVPRGVMVSHANILDNCAYIGDGFDFDPDTRGVMWLPPYHDMGLVGGMFSPVHSGRPMTLMSPLSFLLSPASWLRAISRYGAATSGGPNFAYDLCVRRITAEQREGLDLSSWETAYNGAEPVRADTMDAFTEAFEPFGFRREAFYPCYGLAEATLMVSGGDKHAAARIVRADRERLEQGRFVEAGPDAGDETVALTGCGRSRAGARVEIVDAESHERCAGGEVGEIWVSGVSVARGYWGRDAETQATFGALIAPDGDGPYLRTGDLGFLHDDGELFVTGRISELVVLDDRVLYPAEVELVAERASPALRHNCAAAFTIEAGPRRRLALVAEVREDETELEPVYEQIQVALADSLGLEIAAICLIAPRTIPRTTSGKTRRGHCRELYLRGKLDPVGEWVHPGVAERPT